jgi:hypothetical protein
VAWRRAGLSGAADLTTAASRWRGGGLGGGGAMAALAAVAAGFGGRAPRWGESSVGQGEIMARRKIL